MPKQAGRKRPHNAARKRPYNAALRKEQAGMTRRRILDGARRLLAKGTYSSVTMEEIAREAGVSQQTVYFAFKTKIRLAQEMIEGGFHVDGIGEMSVELSKSPDPEVWLRGGAVISRMIQETCSDLLRFMRESGDTQLLDRYRAHQQLRLTQEGFLPAALKKTGRLRDGMAEEEVLSVIWAMTGPDVYSMLVFDRGWTPTRYEEWLGSALIRLLLRDRPSGADPISREPRGRPSAAVSALNRTLPRLAADWRTR